MFRLPMRFCAALTLGFLVPADFPTRALAADRPNFVIFFTDDLGYGDLSCYGAPRIETPHLDRMAAEGTRFTSFYVQPVCGVSRAALMTGCYPIRVAEVGNTKAGHPVLHANEITLAEVLKAKGYTTALVGKWHLAGGRQEAYDESLMPTGQGFDGFFGTPLHNGFTREVDPRSFKTQIMRGMEILDDFVDQDEMNGLTRRYTEEAVRFIEANRDRPFFLYLAHNMPHVPIGASDAFRGTSRGGTYGDTIEELDGSMGRVLEALEEAGVDDKTLVVFTSDNGPWIEAHLAAPDGSDPYYGSAGPLRGHKMTTWEGGLRVPCIVRWPGRVPAGRVCDEMITSMDVLPTFAHLADARVPGDRTIDGRNVWPVLSGEPDAENPRTTFYYYCYNHLQAVRHGRWKLVLPRRAKPPWCSWSARMVDAVADVALFDLKTDVGETTNVAGEHPEVVAELAEWIEEARRDLGDYNRVGQGARFFDEGPRRPDAAKWAGGAPAGSRARYQPVPYDNAPPVGPLRFDFESGDLQGWRVVEGRFDLLVSDRKSLPRWTDVPLNKQGKYHLSTVETEDDATDKMTGVVESPRFRLEGDRMSFLVGGGDDDRTYVALCTADGTEALRSGGPKGPHFRRVRWDVSPWKGQVVFLRLVDRKTAGWGHVTFDDFSTAGSIQGTADHE